MKKRRMEGETRFYGDYGSRVLGALGGSSLGFGGA